MKNLKTFSLAIAMLISFLTFGQEKTITGTVSDDSGPIPGVGIVLKGTTTGTTSNFDGKYSIKAKIGDVLLYNYIGYETENKTVEKSNVINVKLKENSKVLDEVVVTAMAIKRNKNTVTKSQQLSKSKEYNSSTPNYITSYPKDSGIKINTNEKGIVIRGKNNTHNTNLNDEDYDTFIENPFESPKTAPLSTFSIDVDNASYTNVRRFINNGQNVPKDAVRVEEMVNFFKYNYPKPIRDNPFSITTDYADCAWNINSKIIRIGLQGKDIPIAELPASNLVFLVDVSGSMTDQNKLPLLKESLKILVRQLRKEDTISIVVYAGAAGLVLPPTSGKDKKIIIDALDKLNAGGSTAGGAGIELAYKTAQENFKKNGNNRVILATDGDFNVGSSSNTDMQTLIEEKRKSGVFLTCLGYGMGNYKDSKMEILANKGNGNYAYIDTIQEANRFLGKEFKGSMFAIAKDVKIQIEFNPKHVQAYRLIGYENRKLRPEDFVNDAIDAGELGSGHTVTALYEVIPVGVKSDYLQATDTLKYTENKAPKSQFNDEIATIKFRYKKPDGDVSILMSSVIKNNPLSIEKTSADFKFATAVAWFGLTLRDSKYVCNKSIPTISALANEGIATDSDGYRAEFLRLLEGVTM